jgi:hypothetical protein
VPGVMGPGVPVEAERKVDRHLVVADGDIRVDLEVGPAQVVLDLLVALLDPVPDAVNPCDIGQTSGWVRAAASRGLPERGRLVTWYWAALSGEMAGSAVTCRQAPNSFRAPPAQGAVYG